MSRGKYSVRAYKAHPSDYSWEFNCFGETPAPWKGGDEYNQMTMADGFDDEGYDSYGYSCFDTSGFYIGDGEGVDRAGWSEQDYLFEYDHDQDAEFTKRPIRICSCCKAAISETAALTEGYRITIGVRSEEFCSAAHMCQFLTSDIDLAAAVAEIFSQK